MIILQKRITDQGKLEGKEELLERIAILEEMVTSQSTLITELFIKIESLGSKLAYIERKDRQK